jgi:hypothetical protein
MSGAGSAGAVSVTRRPSAIERTITEGAVVRVSKRVSTRVPSGDARPTIGS